MLFGTRNCLCFCFDRPILPTVRPEVPDDSFAWRTGFVWQKKQRLQRRLFDRFLRLHKEGGSGGLRLSPLQRGQRLPDWTDQTVSEVQGWRFHYLSEDYCVVTEVETIKREIINNGPVVSVIPIYRDFLVYKDGVYKVSEVPFHNYRTLKNCCPALQSKS